MNYFGVLVTLWILLCISASSLQKRKRFLWKRSENMDIAFLLKSTELHSSLHLKRDQLFCYC